jgi:hypothetical protein
MNAFGIENCSETEKVRACIQFISPNLLRRHIRHRKFCVLSLVDYTHASAAQFFEDAIVGNRPAEDGLTNQLFSVHITPKRR